MKQGLARSTSPAFPNPFIFIFPALRLARTPLPLPPRRPPVDHHHLLWLSSWSQVLKQELLLLL